MKEKKAFLIEIVIGIVLAGIGVVTQVDYYSNMIFAMGFGMTFAAVVQIIRITYWQSPKRQAEYEMKKKEQYINSIDERKQCIRAKAGQISYGIMTFVLLFLSFVLALFHVEAWVIGMMYMLFIIQWGIGVVIFRILEKRM